MVFVVAPDALGFTQPSYAAPFEFRIQLPSTTRPGRYLLTPYCVIAPERNLTDNPVAIVVEPSETPAELRVRPNNVCVAVEKTVYVEIDGIYGDGTTRYLVDSKFLETETELPGVADLRTNKSAITGVAVGATELIVKYRGLEAEVPISVVAERDECSWLRHRSR
jgi:hypothetical protein